MNKVIKMKIDEFFNSNNVNSLKGIAIVYPRINASGMQFLGTISIKYSTETSFMQSYNLAEYKTFKSANKNGIEAEKYFMSKLKECGLV